MTLRTMTLRTMTEPLRLRDDATQLPNLRFALHTAGRVAPPVDMASVHARLRAQIQQPSAHAEHRLRRKSVLAGKALLLVGKALLVVGVGLALRIGFATATNTTTAPSASAALAPGVAAPFPASTIAPSEESLVVSPLPVETALPRTLEPQRQHHHRAQHRHTAGPAVAAPSVQHPPSRSQTPDETQAVAEARRTMSRAPATSWQILSELNRTTPHGVLMEEREALSVLALSGLGRRAAALQLAERFFAHYPNSTHAAHLRLILAR